MYVVYRPSATSASFLSGNPGGRFKGQDPAVSMDMVQAKWLSHAQTIYIGKADVARRRLKQFARFGAGDPIGHWGGRYIWHLADSHDLWVAWHAIQWRETAREYEQRLLAHFADLHSEQRPFANLTG